MKRITFTKTFTNKKEFNSTKVLCQELLNAKKVTGVGECGNTLIMECNTNEPDTVLQILSENQFYICDEPKPFI